MKYLKKFESTENNEPQVGDYVYVRQDDTPEDDFLSKNIGVIIRIGDVDLGDNCFYIKYFNVPDVLKYRFLNNHKYIFREDIVHFSKDLETIKAQIEGEKFGL